MLDEQVRNLSTERRADALVRYRELLQKPESVKAGDAKALAESLAVLGLTAADYAADAAALLAMPQHEQTIADQAEPREQLRQRRADRADAMAAARQKRRKAMATFRAELRREQQLEADDQADALAGDAADRNVDQLHRMIDQLRLNYPRAFPPAVGSK
jgi:hypothetical protein